jgi:hypothetical protein
MLWTRTECEERERGGEVGRLRRRVNGLETWFRVHKIVSPNTTFNELKR